jgi:OmpA-OmpF porin, OOP family
MRQSLLFFFLFAALFSMAQMNLVPNPSFEKLSGKPKSVGELTKAFPWISPTDGSSDVFTKSSKDPLIGVPNNQLGSQIPRTGDQYAGAIFFKNKENDSREYLQVELMQELEADEVYCFDMFVSLAELSKYAIDKIGVYFSDNSIRFKNWAPIAVKPQIENGAKRIISNTDDWTIICGQYKAIGGEKFITIGNFYPNEETNVEKIKKPSSIKGTQTEFAYYYIDDVAVYNSDSLDGNCACEKKMSAGANKMNYVYSKVVGEDEKTVTSPRQLINNKKIYFEKNSDVPTQKAWMDVDWVLNILKDNPELKIEIIGWVDSDEAKTNPNIGEKRAQKIRDHYVAKGLLEERFIVVKAALPELPPPPPAPQPGIKDTAKTKAPATGTKPATAAPANQPKPATSKTPAAKDKKTATPATPAIDENEVKKQEQRKVTFKVLKEEKKD